MPIVPVDEPWLMPVAGSDAAPDAARAASCRFRSFAMLSFGAPLRRRDVDRVSVPAVVRSPALALAWWRA